MTQYQQITTNSLNSLTVIDHSIDQETQEFAKTIAQAADDRKADNIVMLQVTDVSYLTDYFVIVTGYSRTQVRAIAEAIEDKVAQVYDRYPLHTEGKSQETWILQDFGDVIVHIFLPEEREFYNLEAFWSHAKRLEFSAAGVRQSQ
ncbi:MAG: ribosome silencing factor [Cyanobacteria bacterium P01_G01_bin.49]